MGFSALPKKACPHKTWRHAFSFASKIEVHASKIEVQFPEERGRVDVLRSLDDAHGASVEIHERADDVFGKGIVEAVFLSLLAKAQRSVRRHPCREAPQHPKPEPEAVGAGLLGIDPLVIDLEGPCAPLPFLHQVARAVVHPIRRRVPRHVEIRGQIAAELVADAHVPDIGGVLVVMVAQHVFVAEGVPPHAPSPFRVPVIVNLNALIAGGVIVRFHLLGHSG